MRPMEARNLLLLKIKSSDLPDVEKESSSLENRLT